MEYAGTNLVTRPDTFFGVCEALGEDFGFNPLYLRLAFPLLLFFQPVAAIGGYAAAGLLVLASRLLFPNPRIAAEAVAEETPEPRAVTAVAAPAPAPIQEECERIAEAA